MKILLTGGNGQLGAEIRSRLADLNFDYIAPATRELDVTDAEQIAFYMDSYKPSCVINCAAYTAVDKAEEERELAFAVNAEGARVLAEAVGRVNGHLIHVSTDYVFAGEGQTPLLETDETIPKSVYGQSKLAGEQEILKVLGESATILRTSSLHGARGQNFVSTMLKLFKEKDELFIVADQIMSPTWAGWLAEVAIDFARLRAGGVYHASGSGALSWYDFTVAIYKEVSEQLDRSAELQINKTSLLEFARPAPRPAFSALNCSKLEGVLGRTPISWEQGLQAHLLELGYKIRVR